MSYEDYITDYNPKRNVSMIYGFNETKQLIFKNFSIPDGITIIGTDESIRRFMNTAATYELIGSGFYPFNDPHYEIGGFLI